MYWGFAVCITGRYEVVSMMGLERSSCPIAVGSRGFGGGEAVDKGGGRRLLCKRRTGLSEGLGAGER